MQSDCQLGICLVRHSKMRIAAILYFLLGFGSNGFTTLFLCYRKFSSLITLFLYSILL